MLQPSRVPRSVWKRTFRYTMGRSPREIYRSRRDRTALIRQRPIFAALEEAIERAKRELAPLHDRYAAEVSSPTMAVSLETAALLQALCETTQPKRVVDLGSGFSSYVVRRWNRHNGDQATVYSVDDNAGWLGKTESYLKEKELPTDNLHTWESLFAEAPPEPFDLVFHDAGSMQFRLEHLEDAVGLTDEGGLLVLDDMHKPDYRTGALDKLQDQCVETYSLKSWTHDKFSRWAYVALP